MAQLPLAAFTSPATNPCSWLFGHSVGCRSDIHCSALIIDGDAVGTLDEYKRNSQLEMLQKCKKCPILGKSAAEMDATRKKKVFACSQILSGTHLKNTEVQ